MLYGEVPLCSKIYTEHTKAIGDWIAEFFNNSLAVHKVTTKLYSLNAHQ
jgi:hypothetical protein